MALRSRTSMPVFSVCGRAQAPGWAACATASAVMLTIPRAVTDGTITCTGLDTPSSSGPTRSASVAADSKVSAILAVSSDGITRRLADPVNGLLETMRPRNCSLGGAQQRQRLAHLEGARRLRGTEAGMRQQRRLGRQPETAHALGRQKGHF